MTYEHASLQLLLAGYFHEDWALDAASPAEVVAQFAKREPEAVDAAIASINAILLRRDSDAAAEAILRDTACGLDPTALGLRPNEWLKELRALLQRHATTM